MQVQCPGCSQMLEVADAHAGQVVNCPKCQGQMQLPAATVPAQAVVPTPASEGPDATKQCPFCGETVLRVAKKCKHCKTDLPEGLDADSVRRRLVAKEVALSAGSSAGQPYARELSFWSRFRVSTLVCAGLTLLFILMFVVGAKAPGESLMALAVLGVVFGIISGIAFLVWLGGDLSVPPLARRITPEKGMASFIKAIASGRLSHAYACLLGVEKDQTERFRPEIPEVKVVSDAWSFANLDGFTQYWRGICRSSGGYSRRMVISRVVSVRTEGDFALVRAVGRIESYPLLALLGLLGGLLPLIIIVLVATKKHSVEITKLLRRVDGQWWVVNGELDSPEDRAFDVAVKVAAEAKSGAGVSAGA